MKQKLMITMVLAVLAMTAAEARKGIYIRNGQKLVIK